MKPLYVIVHEACITQDLAHPHTIANIGAYFSVLRELDRIKENQDVVHVKGWPPSQISYPIPDSRPVNVCGAYLEICVRMHLEALKKRGAQARIYHPATISLVHAP